MIVSRLFRFFGISEEEQIGLHKPRCQDVRTSNIGPPHELLHLP